MELEAAEKIKALLRGWVARAIRRALEEELRLKRLDLEEMTLAKLRDRQKRSRSIPGSGSASKGFDPWLEKWKVKVKKSARDNYGTYEDGRRTVDPTGRGKSEPPPRSSTEMGLEISIAPKETSAVQQQRPQAPFAGSSLPRMDPNSPPNPWR